MDLLGHVLDPLLVLGNAALLRAPAVLSVRHKLKVRATVAPNPRVTRRSEDRALGELHRRQKGDVLLKDHVVVQEEEILEVGEEGQVRQVEAQVVKRAGVHQVVVPHLLLDSGICAPRCPLVWTHRLAIGLPGPDRVNASRKEVGRDVGHRAHFDHLAVLERNAFGEALLQIVYRLRDDVHVQAAVGVEHDAANGGGERLEPVRDDDDVDTLPHLEDQRSGADLDVELGVGSIRAAETAADHRGRGTSAQGSGGDVVFVEAQLAGLCRPAADASDGQVHVVAAHASRIGRQPCHVTFELLLRGFAEEVERKWASHLHFNGVRCSPLALRGGRRRGHRRGHGEGVGHRRGRRQRQWRRQGRDGAGCGNIGQLPARRREGPVQVAGRPLGFGAQQLAVRESVLETTVTSHSLALDRIGLRHVVKCDERCVREMQMRNRRFGREHGDTLNQLQRQLGIGERRHDKTRRQTVAVHLEPTVAATLV
eukprot:scaffold41434_cov63-Phaeocystis_antarctica.AAC.7